MKKKQELFKTVNHILIDYIIDNYPSDFNKKNLPLDKSLLDLDILDSYGVIQLVLFIETNWNIEILDEEITREKMGSINKMVELITQKIS